MLQSRNVEYLGDIREACYMSGKEILTTERVAWVDTNLGSCMFQALW